MPYFRIVEVFTSLGYIAGINVDVNYGAAELTTT